MASTDGYKGIGVTHRFGTGKTTELGKQATLSTEAVRLDQHQADMATKQDSLRTGLSGVTVDVVFHGIA